METFQFKNFSPSAPLRQRANRLLAKILEKAPSDAKVSACLTWEGDAYVCTVGIQCRLYPVAVNAGHRNAAIAIDKAEFALARKLERRGVRLSWEPKSEATSAAGVS
jgi:ribosome-associated translation inhibitor RaiA